MPAKEGGSPGEQRLADLIEANAPGAWDWDLGTQSFIATTRFRDVLGLSRTAGVSFQTLLDATHPDDRAWAEPLGAEPQPGTTFPLLARFRIRHAESGKLRWIASRIWSHRAAAADAAAITGYSGIVEDITGQTETAQALIESEERLRLAIEAGKMAVWEVELETGKMTPSPELNLLCGFEPDATPNLYDIRALYVPGEIERIAREGATVEAVLERAVGGAFEPWRKDAPKRDRTQVQAEVSIVTPAGVPKQLMLRAQYAPSPTGKPRLTGLIIDITEKKVAEERLAVVARELQHRVKNSLSVVRAIAVQSLRGKTDAPAALQSFLGRISALAAATELILQRGSSTAELQDVVEKITRPYRDASGDPFVVSGASMPLPANAATAIGMVLHELCTNAVKYGALSVTGGQVSIGWQQTPEGRLVLTWQESKGPPVVAPSRRGFGSRLVENILSGENEGTVKLDFRPGGVHCHIEMRI